MITPNLPQATAAAAAMPATLDSILSRLRPDDRAAAALLHELGLASAFGVVKSFAEVSFLVKVAQIKEAGAYEQLGYTWADFCRLLPGSPSRSTVDERLADLEKLGAEFLQLAADARLGRNSMRLLRALPDDARPRLLESGDALEFPDGRVVPVDADHRDELREAMQDFAAELERMREQMRVGQEQYAAKADEVMGLAQRVLELEKHEEIAQLTPAEEQFGRAFLEVRKLVDVVISTEAGPGDVERYARMLHQELRPLFDYALGRPDTFFDPDELAQALSNVPAEGTLNGRES